MILVTLGTQDKPFERLIKAVEKQIEEGNIRDEVIVQAGSTIYKSEKMKIVDYIQIDEFDDMIKKADLVITHAGVGSILTALRYNKKVIATARLKMYGEHVNDHQIQILENFSENGYILKLDDVDKLGEMINNSKGFQPKKYMSNTDNFVKNVKNEIQVLLKNV